MASVRLDQWSITMAKPFPGGDAYKITFLPLEESKTNSIRKLTVSDDSIREVEETLAEVHWGALISLSLENGKVIGVTVDYDLLEAHFEYEG